MMREKTITVFGSSLPQIGDKEYSDAYYIGKKLANHGFNICSGGSLGIMDAVSKAAYEEGRKAIGVTVKIFNSNTSQFLTKEIKCDTLFERLNNLVNLGDAYIVLPGGTGTLLELSLVWELLNKNVIDIKPIACLGGMWNDIVELMDNRVKSEGRVGGLIKNFADPDDIIKYVKDSFS
jgi:uncharacterized protein (TIGR00730 family)